jgi:hypothetical protein
LLFDFLVAAKEARTATVLTGAICLGVSISGWMAILLVALLLPGGHPPLVAYVAVPVVLATIPVSVVGVVASRMAILGKASPPLLSWILLTGNGLALLGPVYALIRTFVT